VRGQQTMENKGQKTSKMNEYLELLEQNLGTRVAQRNFIEVGNPSRPDGIKSFLVKKNGASYLFRTPGRRCSESARNRVDRLHEALMTVNRMVDGSALSSTIPKIAVYSNGSNPPVLVESAIPGKPAAEWVQFGRVYLRRRIKRVLVGAVDWLIGFQQATNKERIPLARIFSWMEIGRDVEKYLDLCGEDLDPLALESLKNLRATLCTEEQITVPCCPRHGEFKLENIIISSGRISGVIDWEEFRSRSHPFSDFWHLLVHAAGMEIADRGHLVRGITANLLGLGWMNFFMEELTARFSRHLGVSKQVTRAFLPLHLIHLYLGNADGLSADLRLGGVLNRLLEAILTFEYSRGSYLNLERAAASVPNGQEHARPLNPSI